MILLSKHSLHVTSRHAGVSAWFLIWDSNGPTHIYHTPVITVITILIWYLRCLELSHIFIGSNSLVDQNILHCIIGLRPLTVLPLDAEVLVWARIYQLPNATHQLALVAKVAAEVWGGAGGAPILRKKERMLRWQLISLAIMWCPAVAVPLCNWVYFVKGKPINLPFNARLMVSIRLVSMLHLIPKWRPNKFLLKDANTFQNMSNICHILAYIRH